MQPRGFPFPSVPKQCILTRQTKTLHILKDNPTMSSTDMISSSITTTSITVIFQRNLGYLVPSIFFFRLFPLGIHGTDFYGLDVLLVTNQQCQGWSVGRSTSPFSTKMGYIGTRSLVEIKFSQVKDGQ